MQLSYPEAAPWAACINEKVDAFDLSSLIPLDELSLLKSAQAATGLSNFGDSDWTDAFCTLLNSIQSEAELTFIGRAMSRNDIVQWLKNRLLVNEFIKLHPEVTEQDIKKPTFVVGLPRSGTSLLYELLALDNDVNVPLIWEAFIPCHSGGKEALDDIIRKKRAQSAFSAWQETVPAFGSIHKMSADIPAECGLLMANTFVSDHIASLHQTPSYSHFCSTADLLPVYSYHKLLLQILQYQKPPGRWLLKAPEHQAHLEILLKIYPDANIIHTHRDPIICMASTASLLQALYLIRSNKPFNSDQFEDIVLGNATAERLLRVIEQRKSGMIPASQILDSGYQDLLADPVRHIEGIYKYFKREFPRNMEQEIFDYFSARPRYKDGKHSYPVSEALLKDRGLFSKYQTKYGIPSEV